MSDHLDRNLASSSPALGFEQQHLRIVRLRKASVNLNPHRAALLPWERKTCPPCLDDYGVRPALPVVIATARAVLVARDVGTWWARTSQSSI